METNCDPLVADLFLFCYERDFMRSLAKEDWRFQSRYLGDLININNFRFEQMVHRIYSAELRLNKANASDTEAEFLVLNLSFHKYTVSVINIV